MRGRAFLLGASAVLASLASAAGPASAEWFADLYAGSAWTESHDRDLTFLGTKFDQRGQQFETSASFGGRVGYWLESVPYLGLALDAFHFQPNMNPQSAIVCSTAGCFADPRTGLDLSVVGVSFDAMLRWPLLKTEAFPKGQLQPYITAGPGIFIARGTNLVTGPGLGGPTSRGSDTDAEIGVKAGAGLAWQFHRNLALVAEYRFTHFRPEFKLDDVNVPTPTKVDTLVNTHHIVVGVSFRF